MKAGDVMTRAVISADPDATVLQAARYMLQHHISGLPVIDKAGKLVGVLSEGDFLRRRETQTERRRSRWLEFLMGPGKIAAEYTHSHGSKVSEVMTTELYTVGEDTSLEDIVELMERRRIKRVPVLRGNKVVGIVTRSNLMHAMVSLARTEPKAAKDDAGIREIAARRDAKGSVGTRCHDQCRGARRCGRTMGRDHRRSSARGVESDGRKYSGREGGEGSHGVGRADLRNGHRAQGGSRRTLDARTIQPPP